MGVNLSIKNAPEDVVQRLKERAAKNHRSLQGELLSIIEEAARRPPIRTVEELRAEIQRIGGTSPSEAVEMIRADRDSR